MKTNDTVRVLDGSYSLERTSQGLQSVHLGLMTDSRFKVIKTDQKLPADDPFSEIIDMPKPINDTLIQSIDGRVFYTQQRFLEVTKVAKKQRLQRFIISFLEWFIQRKGRCEMTNKD